LSPVQAEGDNPAATGAFTQVSLCRTETTQACLY